MRVCFKRRRTALEAYQYLAAVFARAVQQGEEARLLAAVRGCMLSLLLAERTQTPRTHIKLHCGKQQAQVSRFRQIFSHLSKRVALQEVAQRSLILEFNLICRFIARVGFLSGERVSAVAQAPIEPAGRMHVLLSTQINAGSFKRFTRVLVQAQSQASLPVV